MAAHGLGSWLSVASTRIEQTRDTRLSTTPFRPDALISLPKGPDVILGAARKGQSQGGVISTAAPSLPPPPHPALKPPTASPPCLLPPPQALP